jgi:hypothetical protein
MKKAFLLLAAATTLSNCQRNESAPEPTEDLTGLKEQFHGKYHIVSATSATAVDLNEDGRASADLLAEIPTLTESDLEVRIGRSVIKEDYVGFLDQGWQHQNLVRNYQGGPDSVKVQGYVNQLTFRYFNFDASRTQLVVEQLPVMPAEKGQYPAPESITVVGPEQLRVVTNRLLFVRKAWTPVRITVLYKRYTKTT